jgi:outer membrane lipoprotein-sorting protein
MLRRPLLAAPILAALLIAAVPLPAPAQAAAARPWDVDQLMALLARVRSGEARFTEQREVKGLEAPLVSSGTLSFTAPDRFARRTLQPRPESMEVDGRIVTLQRGGRSRSLVVDASPEIEAIVEAMRGTLTGNAQSLKQHFKLVLAGSAEQWTLELLPIEPRLQVMLERVRITGRRAELATVEMLLAGGDRSLMKIELIPPGPAGGDKRP